MEITLPQFVRAAPPQGLDWAAACPPAWLTVDVPQPAPDVVPLPPSQHPVPPPADQPPEITEPIMPGQHQPVGDPTVPFTMRCLH